MGGQPLKCRAQARIADPVGRGLNRLGRRLRQVHRVARRALLHGRRLHLELDARQAGELIECHQLTLQAFLLIAQTGGPMAVCDNQQQVAFSPGRHMAVFAGGWLQLAFEQALQMAQALRMAKDGFQRLGFAKQHAGRAGCKRAKCHVWTP